MKLRPKNRYSQLTERSRNQRRNQTKHNLGIETLEPRLAFCADTPDRLAIVISGLGGQDYPDAVINELQRQSYDSIGSDGSDDVGDGYLSNWNSVKNRVGDPGGFPVVELDSRSVTIPGLPGVLEDQEITIPTGVSIVTVNTGNPNSSQQAINEIKALIEDPKYDDPEDQIVIIGHSLGGDTALKIAQATTRNIDLLALLDPVGFLKNTGPITKAISGEEYDFGPVGKFPGIGFSIRIPDNNGETMGFFAGSNLATSVVPSNVSNFYNRWQENSFWPVDFPTPRAMNSLAQRSIQGAINNREYYRPGFGSTGDALGEMLAYLRPDRFDWNPIATREICFLGNCINTPVPNHNFFKTNQQLHFNFPDNSTVTRELIALLREIDPRTRPDRFEINNTIVTATPLKIPPNVKTTLSELTIHEETDVDLFNLEIEKPSIVTAKIKYARDDGDLKLRIIDANGKAVATVTEDDCAESTTFPAPAGSTYYVEVTGEDGGFNTYELEIIAISVDTPTQIDLRAEFDSGRFFDDDITNIAAPRFMIQLARPIDIGREFILSQADIDAGKIGFSVQTITSNAFSGAVVETGVADPFGPSKYLFDFQSRTLLSGDYVISSFVRLHGLEGSASDSELTPFLRFTIDLNPPFLTFNLTSESDSSIPTDPGSNKDRITRDTSPSFWGFAEENAMISLYGDGGITSPGTIGFGDTFAGQSVVVPGEGNRAGIAFFSLQTIIDFSVDLDTTPGLPFDGLRQVGAVAEDLAGNVSAPVFLDILIDTTAPTVTAITLPNDRSVFASKPDLLPTPATKSLVITFQGGPAAAGGLSTPAVDPGLATDVRNYRLVGDQTAAVRVTSAVVVGVATPEMVQVRINFSEPLADDRFTLTILDAISDASGNRLDGESQATSPGVAAALLPSGNGLSGGSFEARFTIDSRPEIGTVTQGIAYLDINGNFEWDPQGSTHDASNRDFVLQMGTLTDAHFAGNFAPAGALTASGFDKLGVYGRFGATYSFMIDTNDDGVGDVSSIMPSDYQVNGIPVAGNFSLAHPGDEIGLFDGSSWYLDTNGNNQIDLGEKIASNFNGLPVVGDFNGDGFDDLATYNNDVNAFFFDTDRDGRFNYRWDVRDSLARFGGLGGFTDRPIAGDLNLDGIDDLGLWVKGRGGQLPIGSGEYFFWVSDRRVVNPALVFNAYSPAPLGNDLFAHFGNENALPIFGNFDPPNDSNPTLPWTHNALHQTAQPLDVNGDNFISPLDALAVINVLNSNAAISMSDPVRALATVGGNKVDVDNDWQVSPLDVLALINYLNSRSSGNSAEGESTNEQGKSYSEKVDDLFACLDTEEWLPSRRRRG